MTWTADREVFLDPVLTALKAQGVRDIRLSGQTGGQPDSKNPWARITFQGGFPFRPEVGKNERVPTTMLTEIFVPSGRAPGMALRIAEAVRVAIRAIDVENYYIFPSRIVAESSEGDFYRVLVASPFEVDVFVT